MGIDQKSIRGNMFAAYHPLANLDDTEGHNTITSRSDSHEEASTVVNVVTPVALLVSDDDVPLAMATPVPGGASTHNGKIDHTGRTVVVRTFRYAEDPTEKVLPSGVPAFPKIQENVEMPGYLLCKRSHDEIVVAQRYFHSPGFKKSICYLLFFTTIWDGTLLLAGFSFGWWVLLLPPSWVGLWVGSMLVLEIVALTVNSLVITITPTHVTTRVTPIDPQCCEGGGHNSRAKKANYVYYAAALLTNTQLPSGPSSHALDYDAKQLHCCRREVLHANTSAWTITYEVHAVLADDSFRTIVTDLVSLEAALFLKQEIERFTNINNSHDSAD